MTTTQNSDRYNSYTYVAAGDESTNLYTFDIFTGKVVQTNVPPYAGGYDALGYRWATGLVYAMSKNGDTLLVIDPVKGTIVPQKIKGLSPGPLPGDTWVLGAISLDGNHLVLGSSNADSDAHGAELDLTTDPVTFVSQNPDGIGGWYDWAYHPNDHRLYAADSDDGSLLYADPGKNPQKVILKEKVFPIEKGADRTTSYSAAFFQEDGTFYVIDNAGNVYSLDLRASSAPEHLITPEQIPDATKVGGVPIPIGKLIIKDAGGDIVKFPIPPSYIPLESKQTYNTKWTDKDCEIYSFDVTITAHRTDWDKDVDVPRWRIIFDYIDQATIEVSSVKVYVVGNNFVIESEPGSVIPAGESRPIRVLVHIPLSAPQPQPPYQLGHLDVRMSLTP